MNQKTLMTDFEIMTDRLSSELGLCASLANPAMSTHLIHLAKCVYELNGSIRGENTVSQSLLEELEVDYICFKDKLHDVFPFVIPQGSYLACHLHIARCTAKQVVRIASVIHRDERQVSQTVLHYAHLLANHLFVLSRYANQEEGVSEVPFVSKNYIIK